MPRTKFKAKWIWKKQPDYQRYHQIIIAKKEFDLNEFKSGTIYITADCYYRLYINNQWVNDGPCRSWPEHYQYDAVDVSQYLKTGKNAIQVIARYFGVGTMHQIPQHPGLLVQLEAELENGQVKTVISDESWQVADAAGWVTNTSRSLFMPEPIEWYNACQEKVSRFDKASVLFSAHKGPWKDLNPRDVELLTRKPVALKSFVDAKVVKTDAVNNCVPAIVLAHPGLIENNRHINTPIGLATLVTVKEQCVLKIISGSVRKDFFRIAVDGKTNASGRYTLSAGEHLIVGFARNHFCHDKEMFIRFINPPIMKLDNPLDRKYENPWCLIRFDKYRFAGNDLYWNSFFEKHPKYQQLQDEYRAVTDQLLREVKNKRQFIKVLGQRTVNIPAKDMFVENSSWEFQNSKIIGKASRFVDNPETLISDDDSYTLIKPCAKGDIELCYDLGEQNCGYYQFELIADEGIIVDVNEVEYIDEKGVIQHTIGSQNGLRYITKKGVNRFLSLKRRSGRFIFLTFRNVKKTVKVRNFQLIESTYPVNTMGRFHCSDENLNKMWEISARTLKLCMEDVFTDCPLYEQTHWVGDAPFVELYTFGVYGGADITKRCIKLAALSLERFPIVGCQLPSAWQTLLPAWSFFWGISVWQYYWYSGDKAFLRRMWKYVIKNLEGAAGYIDKQGLMSDKFWNLLDWSGIDFEQDVVLHNSMLFIAAIDAALKCANEIKNTRYTQWLDELRETLVRAVNKLWDDKRKVYPDSIRNDSRVSSSACQHTSALAIIYDIIEKRNEGYAIGNTINPPKEMVKVGTPYGASILYQAWEKVGLSEKVIQSMYDHYLPMLAEDATTTWEHFPSKSRTGTSYFLTRSHCHAWATSPVYFLNRIVLGVRQTQAAGKSFEISPYLSGLDFASGTVATKNGPVYVRWEIQGDVLNVEIAAPNGVKAKFVRNKTHGGMKAIVNGKRA